MKLQIIYRKSFKYFLLLMFTLVAIMLIFGLANYSPPLPRHEVVVRFLVSQEPSVAATIEDRERLANWQVSEYIAGGLAEWVQSDNFAQRVSTKLLSEQNINVPYSEIKNGMKAENMRSVLKVTIISENRDKLATIINMVAKVLIEQNSEGIPQLGGDVAVVVQLDEFIIKTDIQQTGLFNHLIVYVVAALTIGFGGMFLVNYRDRTIYICTQEEIEFIGLQTLGEIPME